MSGTVLVLLLDLQDAHALFASMVTPVVLSAIAFTELLGPILVQWGLRIAGEQHPVVARRAQAPVREVAA
jgi:hypothetical protein